MVAVKLVLSFGEDALPSLFGELAGAKLENRIAAVEVLSQLVLRAGEIHFSACAVDILRS